jgi:hypothetical protein
MDDIEIDEDRLKCPSASSWSLVVLEWQRMNLRWHRRVGHGRNSLSADASFYQGSTKDNNIKVFYVTTIHKPS